jgi:predicted Zn-dependent protease with MMP-like domain
MRFLLLILIPISMLGQDSCAVFGDTHQAIKMMGYMPDPPSWKTIHYVVHVHHTDSFPSSYVPEDIIYDAHDHLNEEFEEAMVDFSLVAVEYHDLDDWPTAPQLLQQYYTCIPYSGFGWAEINNYITPIVWDRTQYMNVHIFPQFCAGILGFAWLSYTPATDMDGVWVRTDVFGRFGEQLVMPTRMENKTLIHEVGHYVGLHHVFNNVEYCGENLGPCEETGDGVCDTPPTKVNWSCENPICPPGLYNYTPNNHMDYYVDSCRTNFTAGQIERIHAMLPIFRPGITDPPSGPEEPVCYGDISGDLAVGTNDLLLMIEHWGEIDWEQGDVNGDGYFTVTDFQQVLMNWGTLCPGAELDPFYREEQFRIPKLERGRSPFPFK